MKLGSALSFMKGQEPHSLVGTSGTWDFFCGNRVSPPLWLERNFETARGMRILMWDRRSCVVVATFRASTQPPDHLSGPLHMCTHTTQNHHPQGQARPRHPRNLPEAGVSVGLMDRQVSPSGCRRNSGAASD